MSIGGSGGGTAGPALTLGDATCYGDPISLTPQVSGGTAPFAYSLTGNCDATLDVSGRIQFTMCPSVTSTCSLTLTVTDDAGAKASASATVTGALKRFYVRSDGDPNADGESWGTAVDSPKVAMDRVLGHGSGQVWVAAGTYVALADKQPVLTMLDGVPVIGGFSGNEEHATDRANSGNETILSGDRGPSGASPEDSETVVVAASSTRLERFTLTHGNNTGSGRDFGGAGLLGDGVDRFMLKDSRVVGNTALGWGGGARFDTATHVEVLDCVFESNSADRGGAVLFEAADSTVTRVTFHGNQATQGGAIYSQNAASTDFAECRFEKNSATYGAGITFVGGSAFSLSKATFSENTGGRGSALFINGATGSIRSSSFAGNSGTDVGTVAAEGVSDVVVINSDFQSNKALGGGAGLSCATATLRLVNVTLTGNEQVALLTQNPAASITLVNSILWGNPKGEHTGTGTLSATHSCFQTSLSSDTTNTILSASPFDALGSTGELLLSTSSPCKDIGSNSDASAAFSWQTLTTQANRQVDATPVDAGRHYAP